MAIQTVENSLLFLLNLLLLFVNKTLHDKSIASTGTRLSDVECSSGTQDHQPRWTESWRNSQNAGVSRRWFRAALPFLHHGGCLRCNHGAHPDSKVLPRSQGRRGNKGTLR